MAQQKTFTSGKTGPIILYRWRDRQCMRTKPGKVRQTAATKKRSSNFGIASRASKITRMYLSDILSYMDGTRHNRITSAYINWLKGINISDIPAGEMDYLKGLPLNPPKTAGNKWADQFTISRNSEGLYISIKDLIPSNIMSVPKDTDTIKLTISSMILDLNDPNRNNVVTSIFSIPLSGMPASTVQHNLAVAPGSILLSGFAIECKDRHGGDADLRKGYVLPAEIVYAEWMGRADHRQ